MLYSFCLIIFCLLFISSVIIKKAKEKDMISQLQEQGWHLSEEGLALCKEATGQKDPTCAKVISSALNKDLRNISQRYFPENINSGQVKSIQGPIVVQLQKIRNVSAPTINQDSQGAPRMLRLNLTDGVIHCVAIEYQSIGSLKLNLAPGTKICLVGKNIPMSHGVLFLQEENVRLIGGQVDILKDKWSASRSLKKRYLYFNNNFHWY